MLNTTLTNDRYMKILKGENFQCISFTSFKILINYMWHKCIIKQQQVMNNY